MKPHFLCEMADYDRVKEGLGAYCATHAHGLRRLARDLSKPEKAPKPLKRAPVRKTRPENAERRIAYLQQLFNRWIRQRDERKNCIYCNRPIYTNDGLSEMVAAHWLPVSTSEAIRFDDRNVHGSHQVCNNIDDRDLIYFGMIAREGTETMTELSKLARTLRKFTREEIEDKISHYEELLTTQTSKV
jgi:hypothetical protein